MALLRWLTFLLFWVYLFLLMLVFVLQCLFLHPENIHMLFQFPLTLQQTQNGMPCFIAYSCADWDSLCDHLRDVPWKGISILSASIAASEFCEWVQVGIDVCNAHHKYQVKPHSSPWFLAACVAAIVNRNHFFHLYQQNISSELM